MALISPQRRPTTKSRDAGNIAPMSDTAARPGGCLTDQQLAEVRTAQPGKAPEALARHLAGCERCQSRALFGAERPSGTRKPVPRFPSIRKAILLGALVLVAMAAFLWSLAKLTGRVQ
jgi:hypothetical protein